MLDLPSIRAQFPSLARLHNGKPMIYLDGPAGTQVPESVARRVSDCLIHHSANRSGHFDTSREVDQIMSEAHWAAAQLLNAPNPSSIAFGPNMTTLTFQISRALAREWKPGDEIVVTNLDHDANHTPWVLAARDSGATLRVVDIDPTDATLCMDSLSRVLSERTRLVAVTAASNAVGSLTDVSHIAGLCHAVGAELFVDAVHFAPHRRIDVQVADCDYLVCSAYKFFGPHIGILYGRPDRMQSLTPYKLRPAPDAIPGRWMTGTQNHACIAGTTAAIEYMASLSGIDPEPHLLNFRLDLALSFIRSWETQLATKLIEGLQAIDGITIYGITDPARLNQRAPTVAFTLEGLNSSGVAKRLGEVGICVWHGNYYALPLTTALGTEPDGMVRIGCMHYNTEEEIDRTLDAIASIANSQRKRGRGESELIPG